MHCFKTDPLGPKLWLAAILPLICSSPVSAFTVFEEVQGNLSPSSTSSKTEMAVSPSFLPSPLVTIDPYGMAAGLLMDQTIFLV